MNHSSNGTVETRSKKKRSGRFNLIDFLFIVIILLVIATVLYVFAPFQRIQTLTKSQSKTIQYTVEIVNVEESFIKMIKIKENDVVIDSISKNTIGTVSKEVEYHNKYSELSYVEDENGATGILVDYPNRYNLTITISATADYLEGRGYTVNGCRIAVGEKMSLRFPDFSCEGYCIGLTSL